MLLPGAGTLGSLLKRFGRRADPSLAAPLPARPPHASLVPLDGIALLCRGAAVVSETLFDSLPEALSRAEDLPSLPAVAMEVLRLCRDEETTLDDLATCLSRDAALATKLLRFANSSLYNLGDEVTTLQRATLVLGMKTVQMMSLSFTLATSLPRAGEGGFDYGEFWHRSLARAVAARSMAGMVGSLAEDEAFLCGLLAEIGQMVMARSMPAEFEAVLQRARDHWPTVEDERAVLGFDHGDVGGALLRSWELPEVVYFGVGFARRPEELEAHERPSLSALLRIVRLACLTVDVLTNEQKGQALAELEEEARTHFDLAPESIYEFITSLDAGVREVSELFNVSLPSGRSADEILEQARKELLEIGMGTARELSAARNDLSLDHRRTLVNDPARTDSLTGIPDRRAYDRFIELEVLARLQKRVATPLGLLLIELDRLPGAPGNAAHDELLRAVAETLVRLVRKGDLTARLEGKSFGVVMVESSPFGLRTLAERLRRGVESLTLESDAGALGTTLSMGGACIGSISNPGDGRALFEVARRYLDRARARGNQAEVHASVLTPRR